MKDFCGFSFNGQHSSLIGLTRVSTSNRYQDNVFSGTNDTLITVNGRDGKILVNSTIKEKTIPVNFAFDNLTEEQLRYLRNGFNGAAKSIGSLIFDEEPYKEYSAKIQGNVQLKYVCFTKKNDDNKEERIYKGEGSLTFVCYYPYARTPLTVIKKDGTEGDGRLKSSYDNYDNIEEWIDASGITEVLNNPGDLPTEFNLKINIQNGLLKNGSVITIYDGDPSMRYYCASIEINDSRVYPTYSTEINGSKTDLNFYQVLRWNSLNGIIEYGFSVDGKVYETAIIRYKGNGITKLPVSYDSFSVTITNGDVEQTLQDTEYSLNYQYIYY